MVQLWEIRAEQRLTLADYEALGDGHRSGLAFALSRRADATLRALEPAREQIARRIMLRLVHFGEGRADTRRQQPRSALRGADDDPAELDRVLGRLIADRLLTADDDEQTSDGRVDLAHEVMITAWPKLAAWIWDAATGNPTGIPLAHHGDVVSAAFSPDGTRVVTASDDRTARIWETGLDKTPPEDWPALAARSPFVLINGVHVLRSSLALTAGEPR